MPILVDAHLVCDYASCDAHTEIRLTVAKRISSLLETNPEVNIPTLPKGWTRKTLFARREYIYLCPEHKED